MRGPLTGGTCKSLWCHIITCHAAPAEAAHWWLLEDRRTPCFLSPRFVEGWLSTGRSALNKSEGIDPIWQSTIQVFFRFDGSHLKQPTLSCRMGSNPCEETDKWRSPKGNILKWESRIPQRRLSWPQTCLLEFEVQQSVCPTSWAWNSRNVAWRLFALTAKWGSGHWRALTRAYSIWGDC